VLALIAVLLVAALLFGVGFAAHFLWILAAVVLVLWLVGFEPPLIQLGWQERDQVEHPIICSK